MIARGSETCFLRVGRALALLGAGLGAIAALGLLLGLPSLATFVQGRPMMQPATALCLVLAGGAVAYRCRERTGLGAKTLSTVVGLVVLAFGLLTGIEYVRDVELGVDWAAPTTPATSPHPGRPSPLTALALIPLGGALMLFDVVLPRRMRAREGLLLLTMFFAFVALVGHVFGAGALYELDEEPVTGVALPTAIALLLVSAGALLARPDVGVMRLVTSEGPGGVLVRRLGAAAVLLGPVFGTLLLLLVRTIGLRDLELILAASIVAGVFFALLLVVVTVVPFERSHEAELAARRHVNELLEHAPLGVFVANLEGHYTEVNTAGCRLLGYPREEILGKTISELIPETDVQRLARSRERMLAGNVDVDDWRLRRADGTYVPVEVSAKILPDGRWQGFVSDISERLELERRLRESRDFLTNVLESSTEYGIIAEDLDGRIVLWNEGARRSYGYSSEEALGLRARRLVAPSDAADWDELRSRALEQGSAEGALSALRKDGTVFSAKLVCTRRRDPANGAAGVLLVSRDLSAEERYVAEQEFLVRVGMELASCLEYRETVARICGLATSFLGDVCAFDAVKDGALRRVTVVHRDPSKADIVERLLHVSPNPPRSNPRRLALESRQAFIVDATGARLLDQIAISPDHRRALEAAQIHALMIAPLVARGQLLGILSIASCDPSRSFGPADLRVAQALGHRAALTLDNVELFQKSRLQGAVTTNLAEGVTLIRASDARIIYTNPRFEAMMGYGPGELVGRPIHTINAKSDIAPEEQARRIIAELRRAGAWHGEIKNVRKDGSELWSAASVVELDHEEQGKIWISVHSDITERKELEEKNARALREKEVLLKEIHHRVKNNLQVISSLFALQRERTDNDALKTLLDESRMRVQSIALVHEQLYGSADLAVVDLDEYLRGLVGAIGSSYGAEHVRIEASARNVVLDVEEAVPCALLISEIVSNSLKHAFPGRAGTVWVQAHREDGDRCVLEVADDGVGIPADFDWSTARSLGLRLVRSLAHQLRGTVEVDRSKGTRFVIRFPLRHAAPPPPTERAAPRSDFLGEQRP